jgi:ElaB/YqjD/DUF883 family membrane-anchored ribosome-binding protein
MSDEKQSPSPAGGYGKSGIVPPETADKVKDDLQSAADTARDAAERLKQEAQDQVQGLKQQAQDQLGEAKSFAGQQKDLAADRLDAIADAVEKVSDEMADGADEQGVSGYVRQAAGGIRQIAETVKQRDIDEMIGMAQDFGRRQPIAFLGAAALAGFIASRVVMSSSHRNAQRQSSSYSPNATPPDNTLDKPPIGTVWTPEADRPSPNSPRGGAL